MWGPSIPEYLIRMPEQQSQDFSVCREVANVSGEIAKTNYDITLP